MAVHFAVYKMSSKMKNTKMNKNVVPENFTVSLALIDAIPVIFFGASMIAVSFIFDSYLFLTGAVICTLSGAIKVLWKIIVALKKKNVWWMFIQMRILMPVGFVILIASLFVDRALISVSAMWHAVISFPSVVFFALGLLGMLLMIVFSFALDSTNVKANWIEQLINGIAQICIFVGVMILLLAGRVEGDDSSGHITGEGFDDFSALQIGEMDPAFLKQEIDECVQTIINDNVKKKSAVPDDLAKLEALDAEAAYGWSTIIDYWNRANEDDFVNGDMLPDGLPEDASLCIVVLGYQLNPDGSMKDELIGRLETALANHNKYPNSYILVTGGGTASGNVQATEADCMAQWLVENGVASEKIIIENRSKTTLENALYSCAILEDCFSEVTDIAIITSDYHIPLGCVLFNAECILSESRTVNGRAVVANASYDAGVVGGFNMSSQANWLLHLYTRH